FRYEGDGEGLDCVVYLMLVDAAETGDTLSEKLYLDEEGVNEALTDADVELLRVLVPDGGAADADDPALPEEGSPWNDQ
ncbi:MAG: hypothetical protein IJT71_02995, partial [Oscillospiraceae bacterium]|nr:hypothetical protein [Oscillospiraceae bacterium]